jgi:hypothetical protein
MTKHLKLGLLACLALPCAGCVPPAIVFLSPHYDAARVRSVALVGFQDYSGAAGSGKVTAGIFEKYLLLAGYSLVDRSQAQGVLDEQSVQLSDSADLATLRAIGERLGVDAVAFGQISDYSDSSQRTVVEDMPLEQSQPIFGQVDTEQKNGDTRVHTSTQVVTGYSYSTTEVPVQQSEEVDARVGLSVRLVDVETGELLWSGSAAGRASQLGQAVEAASSSIMEAVAAKLKALGPRKDLAPPPAP